MVITPREPQNPLFPLSPCSSLTPGKLASHLRYHTQLSVRLSWFSICQERELGYKCWWDSGWADEGYVNMECNKNLIIKISHKGVKLGKKEVPACPLCWFPGRRLTSGGTFGHHVERQWWRQLFIYFLTLVLWTFSSLPIHRPPQLPSHPFFSMPI